MRGAENANANHLPNIDELKEQVVQVAQLHEDETRNEELHPECIH